MGILLHVEQRFSFGSATAAGGMAMERSVVDDRLARLR
jgi:hypothetical protein